MDNNKEIGKAFKEKLDNLQQNPSDLVWDNIVEHLDKKKKKPFFYILMRAAVIILFIIGIAFVYNTYSNKPKNRITKTQQNSSKKNSVNEKIEPYENIDLKYPKDIRDDSVSIETISKTESENENINKKIEATKSNNKTGKNHLTKTIRKNDLKNYTKKSKFKPAFKKEDHSIITNSNVTDVKSIQQTEIIVTKKEPLNKEQNSEKTVNGLANNMKLFKNNYLQFTFATLPKIEEEILTNKEETKSKKKHFLEISVKGTPIYYNSFTKASAIDASFYDSNSQKTTTSYSVQLSKSVFKKLNFRAGISKIEFSYVTNDLTTESISNSQLTLASGLYNQAIEGVEYGYYLFGNNEELFIDPETTFKLNQHISYIEVPLEFSYKILTKKLELDFITGVSVLLLQNNDILINDKFKLTDENNINKLSYTGNIGLGLKYPILKHLSFTLEPMLKTQFNTYNDSTTYKPYYFGVYSGFAYKF